MSNWYRFLTMITLSLTVVSLLNINAFIQAAPAAAISTNGERLSVRQIIQAISDLKIAEGVKTHVRRLSSLSSRMDGYPGNREAADYIAKIFRDYGLQVVRDRFNVTVPIDRGSFLEISSPKGSFMVNAKALWPNLVETCRTPPEGLVGELVYVGKGTLAELSGKNLTGKIALMEFNSEENWWKNVVYLGARGIVFIEPLEYTQSEASLKHVNVPLDIPRVVISREDAERIMALTGPVRARIHVNMDFEKVTSENIIGILNGTSAKDEIFMITAYYDSFSYIPVDAPGAQESVGISILMELVRFFQAHPPKRTIWFVAFSGHNLQLAGSRWFSYQHYLDLLFWKVSGFKSIVGIYDIGNINLESTAITISALGGFYGNLERANAPYQADMVLKYNAIEDIIKAEAGKTYTFFEIRRVLSRPGTGPLGANLWYTHLDIEPFSGHLSVPALSHVTASRGIYQKTPSDTYDRLNFDNLQDQLEFITISIYLLDWLQFTRFVVPLRATSAPPSVPPPPIEKVIDMLTVQVVEYNAIADTYVDIKGNNTLVVLYSLDRATRTMIIEKTDPNGKVTIVGLAYRGGWDWANFNLYEVDAFVDEPSTGPIEYATDRGRWGTMRLQTRFQLAGLEFSKNITLPIFKCASLVVSETLVPDLTIPVGVRVLNHLTQVDEYFFGWNYHFTTIPPAAVGAAESEGTGLTSLSATQLEQSWVTSPLFTIYIPLNRSVDILMLGPVGLPVTIFNNFEEGGGGYLFTQPGQWKLIPAADLTGLLTVDSILSKRLRGLEESNIYIGYGKEAFTKSHGHLERAYDALRKGDYLTLRAEIFNSLRPQSEAYEEIMRIIHESINTVTAFFPLIFISAFALEKIVINSRTLRSKLAWIIAIMTTLVAILFLIHPAYSLKLGFALNISVSMMIISIIGLMLSAVPIAIVIRRVQITMSDVRRALLGEHEVSISRTGYFFMLWSTGLENLRRRRLRTLLTIITIVIVTSSMVSLVSLEFKYVPKIYEEKEYTAPYNGLLIKERDLRTLPPHLVDFLKAKIPRRSNSNRESHLI